jgi:uncharacterized surface protein with fasciclin (FAS1) repeats
MFFIINSKNGGDIVEIVTSEVTLTDTNNRVSNIIAVDLQVSNDVIHVADKTVLPPNKLSIIYI